MPRLPKFRILLLGVIIALALGVTTVVADKPAPADTGINDPGGPGPDRPGVKVLRRVDLGDGNSRVAVRLNRGDRQAHFNVILRGIEATDIVDANGVNGVDGGFEDGIWGGDPLCLDELISNLGHAGNVAMAKLYTCNAHDHFVIKLSEPQLGNGSFPAIKIVFTEGVLGNVDGVFVGHGNTDVGSSWIPLYGPAP